MAVVLVVLVVGGYIAYDKLGGVVQDAMQKPEFTQAMATETNKQLPMMIDEETELTTTIGLPGVLQYHYRLINYAAAEIDSDVLMGETTKGIVASSCGAPQLRMMLKAGLKLEYLYHGKEKNLISSYTLTNQECITAQL